MDRRPHVLFMTYDGLSDPLGQSQVLPYLEGLSVKGFRFTLMTFEKPDRHAALGGLLKRRCEVAGIRWMPLRYTKRPPVLSTLYDMRRVRLKAEALHAADPVDMVHSRSYLPCLIAVKLKRKFGIPFLFDMRGFYADERVDGNIWNLKNPVYKAVFDYFKYREREFLEEAKAVVSLTQAGKEEMVQWHYDKPSYGGGPAYYNHNAVLTFAEKTHVIPCTADLHHFDPARITDEKRAWMSAVRGIDQGKIRLGYVGSLGTWYMMEEMVDCYAAIYERHPEVHFLLVTQDDPTPFLSRARQRGIPLVQIDCVAASRKEVPVLMSMMAASIFFILPSYSKKASSPTKQGELMAMGVPVICNEGVGDTESIVRKNRSGWVVSRDDAEAGYVKTAEAWTEILKLSGSHLREGAKKDFDLQNAVEDYFRIYEDLI